jgi:CheY-like chemotaxis protein
MTTSSLALVIEDDTDLSMIFSQALSMAGFEVTAVSTPAAAYAFLAESTPQVVTLDLHLEDHTRGDEILQYLHAEPRLAHIHTILTTADAAMADALQDQADIVLIKPISFTQLRDLAARLKAQF